MRRKEANDEKGMSEIVQANKKLAEPLKIHLKDVEELRMELKNYQKVSALLVSIISSFWYHQDKVTLNSTKERVQLIEDNMKNLTWEHEIFQQRFLKMKEERVWFLCSWAGVT